MTNLESNSPRDDRLIDRIVDGELTPAELRAAVDRLECVEDGWKRCALAFLEAQCWRESFRALGEQAESATAAGSSTVQPVVITAKSPRRWLRRSCAAAAIAASFGMGWIGHAAVPWSGPAAAVPVDLVAQSREGEAPAEPPSQTARAQPRPPESMARQEPRPPERAGPESMARQEPRAHERPAANERITAVGRLRLGPKESGTDVPILAGPGIDEQWLRNQAPPLTAHSQIALQQHGYHVDQIRRLVTTTLADGRRVAIPIDQVQIRYTGNNPL